MKDVYCPKCRTQLLLTKEVEKSERIKCTECKTSFFNPYHKGPKPVKTKPKNKRTYKKKSSSQPFKKLTTMQLVIGAVSILFIIGLLLPDDSNTSEVKNSPWDSSVYQVERYIKNNLSDPNSFEVIQWSKVRDMTHSQYGYRYKVMVKYRAKNSFGGYEIQSNIFFLDKKGNVVDVQ
jgi:hypothetical protein